MATTISIAMSLTSELAALLKHFDGITTQSHFTLGPHARLEVRDEDGFTIAVCDIMAMSAFPERVRIIKPTIEGKYLRFDAGLDGLVWGNHAIIRDVRVEHNFDLSAYANALMQVAQQLTYNTRGSFDLMLTSERVRIGTDCAIWIPNRTSYVDPKCFVNHIVVHCHQCGEIKIPDQMLQRIFGDLPRYFMRDAEVIFGTEIPEETQTKILTILGRE